MVKRVLRLILERGMQGDQEVWLLCLATSDQEVFYPDNNRLRDLCRQAFPSRTQAELSVIEGLGTKAILPKDLSVREVDALIELLEREPDLA